MERNASGFVARKIPVKPENCPVSNRNQCPVCTGITVQFPPEWLSILDRNRCPVWAGIRSRHPIGLEEGFIAGLLRRSLRQVAPLKLSVSCSASSQDREHGARVSDHGIRWAFFTSFLRELLRPDPTSQSGVGGAPSRLTPVCPQIEASYIFLCSSKRLTLLTSPTALVRFANPRSSGRDRPFPTQNGQKDRRRRRSCSSGTGELSFNSL